MLDPIRLRRAPADATVEQDLLDAIAQALAEAKAAVGGRRVAGGLDPVRALLAENPLVVFAGDSYVNPATDRLPFQFVNAAAAQGLVPAVRGLYLTNAEGDGARNFGGFYGYATGTGYRLLTSTDGYLAVGGAERVGLPTWMSEYHVTDALTLSTDGRLAYYRLEVEGTAPGGARALVEAAGPALTARVLGYAPETAGALLDATVALRDRASGAPNEAAVNPAQGTGLPGGVPAPGAFYGFPDVTIDNATGTPGWYGALLALDGQAAGPAPDLDQYLLLGGCWVRRPDRDSGPMYAMLGEASWGYGGWHTDAAPTGPESKQFRDEKLTTWLSASRVDADQPLVVVLHLNNEAYQLADNRDDFAAAYRPYVERIRSRFRASAAAAGYGDVAFLLVHGWGQAALTGLHNEGVLEAIRQSAEAHADLGYVSLWADNWNLTLDGSAAAVSYLEEVGEAALAAGGGDLLDDQGVHPASDAAAAFWARRLLAHLFPA